MRRSLGRSGRGRAEPRSVVAAGIVAVVVVAALSGAGGRVTALLDHGTVGGTSRVNEWQLGVDVLRAHPLTGVGPEGYRVTFPTVVTATYERAYGSGVVPDRAHDLLLDVAVTTGLPGLAAYLALLALCGALVLRAVRDGEPWVCGLAAGAVAYTVQELFLFPIGELEPAVWLLVGMVAVRASRPRERCVPAPAGRGGDDGGPGGCRRDRRRARCRCGPRHAAALADLAMGQVGRAQAAANRAVALRPDQIDYRLAVARADSAQETAAGAPERCGKSVWRSSCRPATRCCIRRRRRCSCSAQSCRRHPPTPAPR